MVRAQPTSRHHLLALAVSAQLSLTSMASASVAAPEQMFLEVSVDVLAQRATVLGRVAADGSVLLRCEDLGHWRLRAERLVPVQFDGVA